MQCLKLLPLQVAPHSKRSSQSWRDGQAWWRLQEVGSGDIKPALKEAAGLSSSWCWRKSRLVDVRLLNVQKKLEIWIFKYWWLIKKHKLDQTKPERNLVFQQRSGLTKATSLQAVNSGLDQVVSKENSYKREPGNKTVSAEEGSFPKKGKLEWSVYETTSLEKACRTVCRLAFSHEVQG